MASLAWLLAAPALAATYGTAPLAIGAGKLLSPIPYVDETGAARTVETQGAKLTAVHLWATWCIPCLSELPEVDKASAAYADKGLRIVTISLDTSITKVKQFYADKNITRLPANLDVNTAAFKTIKPKGLPATVFLNEKGEVVARADGPLGWTDKETMDFIESRLK